MSVFAKLVPMPLTSGGLLAAWLLLARSTSLGQVLLGLGLALVIPHFTPNLRLTGARVRRPLVIVRFLVRVGWDVIASNANVAAGIIAWAWREPRSEFVVVPLDLRDPVGLAVLSMVTTIVPGTVWSELALDRSALLLHVWDLRDEQAFIALFKARYEAPLREIFE